jgi:predicted SAM-dependent methyltransferase
MTQNLKVHFGCGQQNLKGWVNVDFDPSCKPDLIADLRRYLPFRSLTIDYIHSEDFIEHLELGNVFGFFEECHRILKEGGVMRVLTPDLYQFARRYVKGDKKLLELWEKQVGIPLRTRRLGEVFNLGMRLGGHIFLFDEALLVAVLKECGFESKKVKYNWSEEAPLRGLDIRSPQTALSMYYDCYKGKRPKTKWQWFRQALKIISSRALDLLGPRK